MAPRILISSCLAGLKTRYDGQSRPHPHLKDLSARFTLVPVCPEVLGGLGIPRPTCHFHQGDGTRVLQGAAQLIDSDGRDRTSYFLRGAQKTLRIVETIAPVLIVFKEGSPSCGLHRVNIDGRKKTGCGVTAALLRETGIPMITEDDPVPEG